MHVVATAGHVDHGKSTLVRALTGMEPDRWAEERRRGMTIDLGYAWTSVGGRDVVFVDVPGHERFLPNTLAGLGPAPAVLLVVAADQGWQEQSTEHVAAVRALGVRSILVAVTRSDLADPALARDAARQHCADSGMDDVRCVAVSSVTGAGLEDLRTALVDYVAARPRPPADGRVRLWIDRAFTITGAGTVVTGTLQSGTIAVGDRFDLTGEAERVQVRGLQVTGLAREAVSAPARVALNLRGVDRERVGRGRALITPGRWWLSELVDVRVEGPVAPHGGSWTLHVGTAALPVHVRPLGGLVARIRSGVPLPLAAGDRAILRDPGSRAILGVQLLDVDPPALSGRGAAARRAVALDTVPDAAAEVRRRGAMTVAHLERLGYRAGDARAERVGEWLVEPTVWVGWQEDLRAAVDAHARSEPLAAGLSGAAAARAVALPDESLLRPLVVATDLVHADGLVRRPGAGASLGPADAAVAELERRLDADPFAAPERPDLVALGLGQRELTVAARAGRLLRLPGEVVLRPDAPVRALALLGALAQPFTAAEARAALGTTRRVAIPLLEHLDAIGLTERVDAGRRRVL